MARSKGEIAPANEKLLRKSSTPRGKSAADTVNVPFTVVARSPNAIAAREALNTSTASVSSALNTSIAFKCYLSVANSDIWNTSTG